AMAPKQNPLKALTIRQPWAELILRRRKLFEIRSWRTNYRGPLVVHAGSKVDFKEARLLGLNPDKLPTGCFVGVVDLKDVVPFTRHHAKALKARRAYVGSWSAHYFAWVVKNPRRFRVPVNAKGKLSIFKVPPRVRRL